MANEVVKYHNRMNNLSFSKFTKIELDIFFSICTRLKNQDINKVILTFDEIKKLSQYKATAKETFVSDLKKTYKKLISLNFYFEDEEIYSEFVLFNKFTINKKKGTVSISVNEEFKFILNELTANFTRFELDKFVSLKSSYSKQLFKLLSQFNSTGKFIISMSDFRNKLDIPISYKMNDINKRVLNVIEKELTIYFKNLKLEKIKKGRSIDKLIFSWQKRKELLQFDKGEKIIFDLLPIEEKIKVIEKGNNQEKLLENLAPEIQESMEELKVKLGIKNLKKIKKWTFEFFENGEHLSFDMSTLKGEEYWEYANALYEYYQKKDEEKKFY